MMQSFFYFSKIYDNVIGVQYELDYMYEDLLHLYNIYSAPDFNDPLKSEYECIVEFFRYNRVSIFSYIKPNKCTG